MSQQLSDVPTGPHSFSFVFHPIGFKYEADSACSNGMTTLSRTACPLLFQKKEVCLSQHQTKILGFPLGSVTSILGPNTASRRMDAEG